MSCPETLVVSEGIEYGLWSGEQRADAGGSPCDLAMWVARGRANSELGGERPCRLIGDECDSY